MKTIVFSILLLLYACAVMYLLLDVHWKTLSKIRKITGALFFCIFLCTNILVQVLLGKELYGKLYLLFTQLPVYFLFFILSKYKGIKLLFVLLTTVIFSSPVMVILSLSLYYSMSSMMIYMIYFISILFLIERYFKGIFHYILEKADNSLFLLFSIIPLLYYVYNYMLTKYQYAGREVNQKFFIQQIPLLIVIVSYILLVQIFHMVSEKSELKNQQNLIYAQLSAATEQISQLRKADQQLAIYRHDIRHHMNYLNSCISQNRITEAKAYIEQTCESIDHAKVERYARNESLNLILSSYINMAKEKNILIKMEITEIDLTRFQVMDLCSLLANAFENAILACSVMEDSSKRYIIFRMYERNNKMCLDIRNSYQLAPVIENGVPVSYKTKHGIGVVSMIHVIEKYNGVYRFSIENQLFVFQATL